MITEITEFVTNFNDLLTAIIAAVPSIVGVCSMLAAFIPPQENGLFGKVRKLINAAAFNFKHARNADDV